MAKSTNPFRYFDSSPEVIRTVVMMYVKYPLSLRNVEDLLAERGIDIGAVRVTSTSRKHPTPPPFRQPPSPMRALSAQADCR